ncbi:hypothetical protein FACS1894181_18110 [Bacteroidia bacterium]|nr:hypothetical protein FACS1894181_18110 [Bacteroidia bacterium]
MMKISPSKGKVVAQNIAGNCKWIYSLACDNRLPNFVEKDTYNMIKADSQYKAAVKRSQQRLWRPYMLSVANHWCKFEKCSHYIIDSELSKQYNPTLID